MAQTKLSDVGDSNKAIAHELAKKQRDISISQFFEKNRHLLGFDNKKKALMTTIKEAVDNSLDACEEANVLPEVSVEVIDMGNDRFRVIVEDNGPGIVKKQIPNIFAKLLYGSKFHSMKQSLTSDEPIMIYYGSRIKILSIGSFVDSLIAENEIKDVACMDIKAPVFDKHTKIYSWKNISHVIKHKRENEIIKIKATTGRIIKVTGCHSLFTFNENTNEIEEVEARNLKIGDYILAPKQIPPPEEINEINILNYITASDIQGLSIFVYGLDNNFIKQLFSKAEIIHKKTDKSRKFYRFKIAANHIDVLDDSYKQYLSKCFLPLKLVLQIRLEEVKYAYLQTYYHGKPTRIPITWQITSSLMRFLGLFVAEGHSDIRQAGFTFGLHEENFVNEIVTAARTLGSNITIEKRLSSYRVKVFGSILPILLKNLCGKGAKNKKIPEFVFRATKELRQAFLDGLYQGDGHLAKKRNCLSISTVSQELANQLLYLWLMQGVLATYRKTVTQGLGKFPSALYVVNVYGKDIEVSNIYKPKHNIRWKQTYKLINSNITNNTNSSNLLQQQQHLCLLKIKKIEIINQGYGYVYDLSIPYYENFVGGLGGIACHNSRGQQGIGISAAVLYAQLTTGRPAKITSKIHPKEPAHYYELHINTNENKPEIVKEDQVEWNKEHGTKIEIDLEASYQSGNQSIDEYLKETSIVNPHATIIYTNPKAEQIIFPRATQDLPAQAQEIKPHPYGVELGMLIHMLKDTESRTLQSFLSTEFTRVGSGTAKLICENSALLPNTKPKDITRETAEKLFQGIQKTKLIAPPTDCISPIGQELLERGLKKEVNAEFYATTTRQPAVYRGNPFVVEAGIAYGGQQPAEESIRVMRFANRVPLLYQHGACAVTKSIVQTAWRNYGMSQSRGALPIGPCTVIVHIASVWVPFTSESKEAIAHYPEIIKEIKLALQDCGRQLASYVNKKKRIHAESAKRDYIETFIPHVSDALKTLLGFKEDEKEKVEKYLREILEKHRGQLEDIDFDPSKNLEYDEEMANIGKSSEDIEDVHVEEETKTSKKKKTVEEESDE